MKLELSEKEIKEILSLLKKEIDAAQNIEILVKDAEDMLGYIKMLRLLDKKLRTRR